MIVDVVVVVDVDGAGGFCRLCAGDFDGEDVRSIIERVGVRGRFADDDIVNALIMSNEILRF